MRQVWFTGIMFVCGALIWLAMFAVLDIVCKWNAPGYAYFLAAMIGTVHFTSASNRIDEP